ncbi:MAG TPA: hypothetical protein VGM33_02480 [Baekduia sp.]
MPRVLSALALALAALCVAAAPALATTETASAGKVKATFSYKSAGQGKYTNLRLTVRRAGGTTFRATPSAKGCAKPYCAPYGAVSRQRSLKVRDLDGDGEPEVIVDLYSGGAHCCEIAYVARFTGSSYAATTQNFADVGYTLKPPAGHGKPMTFAGGDARFGYAFASFADSAFPVQLWTFAAGRFTDVTRKHPATVKADAARWMKAYLSRRDGTNALGILAAWVADEYLLGQAGSADAYVAAEAAAGRLKSEDETVWPGGDGFVAELHKQLQAWGYGTSA